MCGPSTLSIDLITLITPLQLLVAAFTTMVYLRLSGHLEHLGTMTMTFCISARVPVTLQSSNQDRLNWEAMCSVTLAPAYHIGQMRRQA